MKSDSIVIIPTYNEKENIEKIIRRVFSYEKDFNILVVDDNSPDGTGTIVKSLMNEFPERLYILERTEKQGLGLAYIAGFKWSLQHSYEYIFEMDADFSHNPDDLIRLYNACALDGADAAVGSRYVTGVNVVNWPMKRVLLSYFASKYVRFITRMPLRDATAGFVCYKSKVLQALDLDAIQFKGYAFQIEMKFKIWDMKFSVVEVPIIFTDRKEGTSKMSGGIIKEAAFGVIKLKIQSWFKK
ncbi:MAG: polyprenol monophosphomannose synthase [Bacteroidales bacterium]|nr:polyprenol monophosphomannose synthase [Bacteroidales bacterium]MBP5723091.1 polyprenol monophosphomannose synthase [Bacteroidales bacterium]MBQ4215056.1 polyprenol monophosphomannose synthase [Bacteroidales bacterium]MBR4497510.1 polyprenol monophosphomannose synthase [Bacteroidales bacterium]